MADIDFGAMQQARADREAAAAKASKSTTQDAATHAQASSTFDDVMRVADGGVKAVGEFAKGMVKSSPVGAAMATARGKEQDVPGIAGAIERKAMSPQTFSDIAAGKHGGMAAHALFLGNMAASTAEWWGFGKAFGAIGGAIESRVPPVAANLIKAASNSIGLRIGDEQAGVIGRRVLASTVAGAALTPAAGAVQGKIEGRPSNLKQNLAIGALLGAVGGFFEKTQAQLTAADVDNIHNTLLSENEKGDVTKFSNLAKAWGKTNGYSHAESMRRLSQIALGAGSDVDRIAVKNAAEAFPEMFEGGLNGELLKAARSGKSSIPVPTAAEVASLQTKGEVPVFDIFDMARPKPGAAEVPVFNAQPSVFFESYESTPDFHWGPKTYAGTPVETPESRYVIPPSENLPSGIPDAPKVAPFKLSKTHTEIMNLATGHDPFAEKGWTEEGLPGHPLEKAILKNDKTREAFGQLVVSGRLRPEQIRSSNIATIISGEIKELHNDLPKDSPAVFGDYYQQLSDQFDNRAAELRGSEKRDFNEFVRSPRSGDIVRPIDIGGGKIGLIDKEGKIAIFEKDKAPQHILRASIDDVMSSRGEPTLKEAFKPDIFGESAAFRKFIEESKAGRYRAEQAENALARRHALELQRKGMGVGKQKMAKSTSKDISAIRETEATRAAQQQAIKEGTIKAADLINPNDLKAVEAAIQGDRPEPIEPRPTPGINPISEIIRQKLMEFGKGSITIGRGRRITDSLAGMLAERLGGELHQVPEGFVTVMPHGEERVWPSEAHAFEYLRNFTTGARIAAEQDQVANEWVSHLDPDSPNAKKLAKLQKKFAKPINVPNLREVADLYKGLSQLEPGEGPTLLQRLRPLKDPGRAIRAKVERQHAALMEMGDGGVALANLAKQRGAIKEYFSNWMYRSALEPMLMLKKMGYTVRQIEQKTAPGEAMELFRGTFGRAAKMMYDTYSAHGGDVAAMIGPEKDYVHHYFAVKGGEIPQELLDEARKMGVSDSPEGVAAALNDPEGSIPKPSTKQDLSAYLTRIQWAREKAASVAHALQTERRGNEGYTDDLEVMFRHYVESTTNRLADTVTFGPKNEAINYNLQKIAGNASYTPSTVYYATEIMNDVRGRHYIPMSDIGRLGGNAIRLWLGASGPKHLFQNALTWARFGTVSFAKGAAQLALHGVFFGEHGTFTKNIAGEVGWLAHDLGDHPDEFLKEGTPEQVERLESWAANSGLKRMGDLLGKFGTASLHVVLNADRLLASRVARNVFPSYLQKAIAGNADALAVLSETFHSRVTPEFLKTQDPATMAAMFAKETADWVGMTYRPEDFPNIARSQIGRELMRFRTYRWNLFHNLFNEMNNPRFSYARRAKTIAKVMMAVPVLGSLDPIIRHHMGISTIDSEVAYDAWERFKKHPTLGKAAYMLVMLGAHAGAFGLADEWVQGFNLRDQTLIDRVTSLNYTTAAPVSQLIMAGSRAAHAALKHNPREAKKARDDALRIISPTIASGIQRYRGTRRPVRLPKERVLQEAGDRLDRAVGSR